MVLYTYRCAVCSHRGKARHDDDSHDSDTAACTVCGAAVTLEWDGGVTLVHAPNGEEADEDDRRNDTHSE
jgi:DNA-directed RNA polymerase subunit RPC12/RpoP